MSLSFADLQKFQSVVNTVVTDYEKVKPLVTNWVSVNHVATSSAFQYVTQGLDQLVGLANVFNIPGADKKTLVMQYADQLFSALVTVSLPTVLKPFAPTLETVFNAAMSGIVEFLVSKLVAPSPAPQPAVPVVPAHS